MRRGERAVSWHPAALCLGSALGLIGLFFVPAMAPTLLKLEHWTADWRTALLSDRRATTHPDLAIVAITSETLEPYPFILPVDRGLQAKISQRSSPRTRAPSRSISISPRRRTPRPMANSIPIWPRSATSSSSEPTRLAALSPPRLAYQYDFLGAAARARRLPRSQSRPRRRGAVAPAATRSRRAYRELLGAAGGRGRTQAARHPERIAWLLPPTRGGGTFLRVEAHRLLDPAAAKRPA